MIVTKAGIIWDTTLMFIILNSNKNDYGDFVDDVDNGEAGVTGVWHQLRPIEQTGHHNLIFLCLNNFTLIII